MNSLVDVAIQAFGNGVGTVANADLAIRVGRVSRVERRNSVPCSTQCPSGASGALREGLAAPLICQEGNALASPRSNWRSLALVHVLFYAWFCCSGIVMGVSNHDVLEVPSVGVKVDVAIQAFGNGVGTVANADLAIRVGRVLHPLAW